jgi:hypothetical protein
MRTTVLGKDDLELILEKNIRYDLDCPKMSKGDFFSFDDEEGSTYTLIVYRVLISLDSVSSKVEQIIYVDYEEEENDE